jgi:hypothetical protein
MSMFGQVVMLIAVCLLLVKLGDMIFDFEDDDGGDDL